MFQIFVETYVYSNQTYVYNDEHMSKFMEHMFI